MPVSQVLASQVNSLTYQDNSWSGCRTNPNGSIQPPPSTRDAWVKKQAGRGGTIYDIARIFTIFDTSAFAGTITAVDLLFSSLGSPNTLMNVIAVESTAYGGSPTGPINISDYGALNWAQTYTAANSIPTAGTGITLTGNANFVSLANTGTANIAIINGAYDQQDVDPAGQIWTEIYLDIDEQNLGSTYLSITHTAAGYGNDVNGVASADISSINAVATADIFEVNGV
tara:strand:- start:2135 stop:2818 length:684 start_codon:yes stop_codon:yes gene_type:complete